MPSSSRKITSDRPSVMSTLIAINTLIGGFVGFVTAVTALIVSIRTFPVEAVSLLFSHRESGFVKASEETESALNGMRFKLDISGACESVKAQYVDKRNQISTSKNI